MLKTKIGRLRIIGLFEGVSLLCLIGIAVPLKHIYGNSVLVKTIGPIHGLLFILFVLNTLSAGIEYNWKFKATTWKILLACMIPFGTFYIDQKILREIIKNQ